ncbi:PssD/Cps14F family polysaccharide biosynthesis glycosyltransferase [Glaciecola punicea]|nr:PssD/Cps14F family polysaccharide biosynthesis glycosyltransferase [Glaciecola punicea]
MLARLSGRIYVCAGEGGHLEQAQRFVASAAEHSQASRFVIYTDASHQKLSSGIPAKYLLPVSKYSKQTNKLSRIWSYFLFCIELIRFVCMFIVIRPDGLVLFGPLVCIPIAVAGKLMRVPVVYIETWSRFTAPTRTGRIIAKLGIKCFYQNKSLASFYDKFGGKYAGRL